MSANTKKLSVVFVAASFFLLDRLVKLLFLNYYFRETFRLVGDWLQLQLALNSGIAFSLPLPSWLIIGVSVMIIITLINVCWWSYQREEVLKFTAWLFLTQGALSNLIDRWHYGAVVDYFGVKYFTIFNLADVAITLSIVYLLLKVMSTGPTKPVDTNA